MDLPVSAHKGTFISRAAVDSAGSGSVAQCQKNQLIAWRGCLKPLAMEFRVLRDKSRFGTLVAVSVHCLQLCADA